MAFDETDIRVTEFYLLHLVLRFFCGILVTPSTFVEISFTSQSKGPKSKVLKCAYVTVTYISCRDIATKQPSFGMAVM